MRRKLRPIKSLSKRQAEKRRLARRLGLRDEYQLDRWLQTHRSFPEQDIRHLRPGIADDDFVQLNRLRQIDKRYKTPAQRLRLKKQVLTDTHEANVHLSAFAFLDRYREQIEALLRDANTSDYRKRQLRQMLKDLQQKVNAGDIGRPRQMDLFGEYNEPKPKRYKGKKE